MCRWLRVADSDRLSSNCLSKPVYICRLETASNNVPSLLQALAVAETTLREPIMLIRVGHSPDPDDAFMFYALAANKIDTAPYTFEHNLQDIQTLNERALRSELEVSAISIAAYPHLQDSYVLLDLGASMGDGYGPMVVATESLDIDDLQGRRVAVPGTMTTAFLSLSLLLGKDAFTPVVLPFDEVLEAVAGGRVEAGLIIHEGQLTYAKLGLNKLLDLGEWWKGRTSLPLPLGGNVIRRDLPERVIKEVAGLIRRSIEYGLSHRDEALAYAMQFARGLDRSLAEQFVGMYVNEWTLQYGPAGREAVRKLLDEAAAAGLVERVDQLQFVG